MFYQNPGRNATTDTPASSANASVTPHTGNLTIDEDSPKTVVRAASTAKNHPYRRPAANQPDAEGPARLGRGSDSPGRSGLPPHEDNKIEAARAETDAGRTQLRNVLT